MEDQAGMCDIVQNYFMNIFSGETDVSAMSSDDIPMVISSMDNEKLIPIFSMLNSKQLFMRCTRINYPVLMVYPAFFQYFWNVMGNDVFLCCKDWLDRCKIPADMNTMNNVLIPEKENPSTVKDFRPIALCNVLYKIIVKVLSNRLKRLLPGMISENQSAFVPGRIITDNVLVAFEIIHHMKRKHSGTEEDLALKLDISKAYDRLSWCYLRAVMRMMGFCSKWINWIMLFVSTVEYHIYFNNDLIGPITP